MNVVLSVAIIVGALVWMFIELRKGYRHRQRMRQMQQMIDACARGDMDINRARDQVSKW